MGKHVFNEVIHCNTIVKKKIPILQTVIGIDALLNYAA